MIPTISLITIAAGAIMFASLIGVIFTWKFFDQWLRTRLSYMIALAMGVFVMIVYGLLHEVVVEGFGVREVIAFIFGAILLKFATSFLPDDSHHHHHGSCNKYDGPIDARRVLIGDAIHNVHDGLVLAPAFFVSPTVGIGTAIGIFLHEIVQEIAEFFILRKAGYSVKKALLLNFLVSATILLGIGLSVWFATSLHIETLLVALSAGGFSYIITRDLAPTVFASAKENNSFRAYLLMFMLGIILMLSLQTFIPHGHPEYEDEYPLPEGFELALTVKYPEMV